jgi:hypothetical protein
LHHATACFPTRIDWRQAGPLVFLPWSFCPRRFHGRRPQAAVQPRREGLPGHRGHRGRHGLRGPAAFLQEGRSRPCSSGHVSNPLHGRESQDFVLSVSAAPSSSPEYTYAKAAIAAGPHASRSIRSHHGLHGAVSVFPRLAAIRVGDKLGLRGAVGMIDVLARRGPRWNGIGGNLPLGNACR